MTAYPPPTTLLDLLETIPAERTAIILPEQNVRVSYDTFRSQAQTLAETLAGFGIGRGDRVGIAWRLRRRIGQNQQQDEQKPPHGCSPGSMASRWTIRCMLSIVDPVQSVGGRFQPVGLRDRMTVEPDFDDCLAFC